MKKLFALILAVLMVATLAACGQTQSPTATDGTGTTQPAEKRTFTMGIDAEYPPFSYLDDNGEYAGFDVEICKAVCEKLGWEFKVFGVNWDQKLIQLDAQECDCVWSGMTILDSMKEAGYVISEPYFSNTQVLVVKEDSNINGGADLAGKYVAVQLGTSGEALLAEDGDQAELAKTFEKLVTCDDFTKCFAELSGNAVDAVFVDEPVAVNFVNKNEGFKIVKDNLGTEEYGIAFRNGDEATCKAVENAVQELVADGTYKTIAEKYPDIDQGNLIFLK